MIQVNDNRSSSTPSFVITAVLAGQPIEIMLLLFICVHLPLYKVFMLRHYVLSRYGLLLVGNATSIVHLNILVKIVSGSHGQVIQLFL